jgi:ribosomal protein L35AE/L33A
MCPYAGKKIEFWINRVFGTDGRIIAKTRQQFKRQTIGSKLSLRARPTSLGPLQT